MELECEGLSGSVLQLENGEDAKSVRLLKT